MTPLLIVCAVAFTALCLVHYYRDRAWRFACRIARLVAVVRALPHCIECGALATRIPSPKLGAAGAAFGPRCDDHRPPWTKSDPMVEVDWARALRDLRPDDLPRPSSAAVIPLPAPQILGVPIETDDAETTPFSRKEFEEASAVIYDARAKFAKRGGR